MSLNSKKTSDLPLYRLPDNTIGFFHKNLIHSGIVIDDINIIILEHRGECLSPGPFRRLR